MSRLKQKLKSEYGASILLALLFFLICGLVTAALLMSAVSNAGKIKNNEESHQKYLTVSSALEMVCEDLLSEPYVAKYHFMKTPHTTTVQDGDTETTITTYTYEYAQQEGEYSCGMGKYLLDELDSLFGKQMETDVKALQENHGSETEAWTYTILPNSLSNENIIHTFEVKPTGTGGADTKPVMIFMTLDRKDRSYTINLTARLKEDAAYAMEAELTPVGNQPQIDKGAADGDHRVELNWNLGWITKAE